MNIFFFWSCVRQFASDFYKWHSQVWKLSVNCFTSDQQTKKMFFFLMRSNTAFNQFAYYFLPWTYKPTENNIYQLSCNLIVYTSRLGDTYTHQGTGSPLVQTINCLTHLPLDKMAVVLQTIYSHAFSWMKSLVFWLKFHWSLFGKVHLTITQHWFWFR